MLNRRCVEMIRALLQAEQPVSIRALSKQFGVSERTVRTDLDAIDAWLGASGCSRLLRTPGVGISLADLDSRVRGQLNALGPGGYIASSQERQSSILLSLLLGDRPLSTASIAAWLEVSTATVSNDLRQVRGWLAAQGAALDATPHGGIRLGLPEGLRRRLSCTLLHRVFGLPQEQQRLIESQFAGAEQTLGQYRQPVLSGRMRQWRQPILDIIRRMETLSRSVVSDADLCGIFFLLFVQFCRIQDGALFELRPQESEFLQAHRYAERMSVPQDLFAPFFVPLCPAEQQYIALQWMALKKYGGGANTTLEDILFARQLLEQVWTDLGLEVKPDELLVKAVAAHLNALFYRIIVQPPEQPNPLCQDIEQNFGQIFASVEKAAKRLLRQVLHTEMIRREEVAYLAMYVLSFVFGENPAAARTQEVIIVCGNTIATSRMLESRLLAEFSNIKVLRTLSYAEFLASGDTLPCRIILSTIPLQSPWYQCITVNPLLREEDIRALTEVFSRAVRQNDAPQYINATLNIVSRTLRLSSEERLRLSFALTRDIRHEMRTLAAERPAPLKSLLTADYIRAKVPVSSCCEAIRAAGQILCRQNGIRPEHVEEMVALKKKYGGYIVIDPGVAMPHLMVRDRESPCVSIITLKEPVPFGNPANDPVSLVIMLIASDATSHFSIIENLIALLNDTRRRQKILEAETAQEILDQL